MKWKDVKRKHKFKDGSEVTQRHQTHLYDCYKLVYIDNDGIEKSLIASKDHLIEVDISAFPQEAKDYVEHYCSQGKIPLRENISCEILGYVDDLQKKLVYSYVIGGIDDSAFQEVIDISQDHFECYQITFKDGTYREVFVKRFTIEEESQKIDDVHYWVPLEGVAFLLNTFGELSI